MAKLNTTFTLRSTTISSSSLNISITDELDVSNPVQGLSRESVATNADTEIVSATKAGAMYVYLKNMDPANYLELKTDAQADAASFATLNANEAILFCVPASTGLHLRANTQACVVEYATFTKT